MSYLFHYQIHKDGSLHVILQWSLDGGKTFQRKTVNDKPIALISADTLLTLPILGVDCFNGHIGLSYPSWDQNGGMNIKFVTFKYVDLDSK